MPPLRSLHRWSLVALGVLAMALSFLERQTLSVLAPTVCRDLGLSNVEYGWTGSVFALSLLVATPLAGAFLDRAGVRRGLLAATLAWSFASAAHGLAAGLGSLIVLRALLGVASLNLGFGGEDDGGIYHSIYDDFYWYTHFSDTDFRYGRALSQTIGVTVMRLAGADLLPFDFRGFTDTVRKYVDELEKLWKSVATPRNARHRVIRRGRTGYPGDAALSCDPEARSARRHQ